MIFPTCLPVAPIDMEATVGGSGGLPLDTSLETGRGEEKNMEIGRLKFLVLQETGTRLEQGQEEAKIARTFFERLEVMKKKRVKEKIYS